MSNNFLNFVLSQIREIGTHAFLQVSIQNIIFPKWEFTLNDHAFYQNTKLQSVTFENLLSNFSFNGHPFEGCSSLSSIFLPEDGIYPTSLSFKELFKGSGVESKDWSDFGGVAQSSSPPPSEIVEGSSVGLAVAIVFLIIFLISTIVFAFLYFRNSDFCKSRNYIKQQDLNI